MKLLILDLDFTLVDTSRCQSYLKTFAGREAIVELLNSRQVATSLYSTNLVNYINSLVTRFNKGESDTLPIIISDSPKRYCEAVLSQHNIEIDARFVFGAARKPCVDFDNIISKISELDIGDISARECLVVGDNARDIHFAHSINSPSVWTKWGYVSEDYMFHVSDALPTREASNTEECIQFIEEFVNVGNSRFEYEKPDFKGEWNIEAIDLESYEEHQVEDIGYIKHYVPDALSRHNANDKSTFFEVHWVVKPAKNVPKDDLWRKVPQPFYKRDGEFKNAEPLIRKAGIYKFKFKNWLDEKKITGKVLLVPVPSSVPAECNKTHTVKLIAEWWVEWLNGLEPKPSFELVTEDLIIERFQPKLPTHVKKGQRFIEDQLSTMGVLKAAFESIPSDIEAVVFLDDVSTSGHSINAMATIFRELEVVSNDTPLFGYVWYKTHHPEFDIEDLMILADEVALEN